MVSISWSVDNGVIWQEKSFCSMIGISSGSVEASTNCFCCCWKPKEESSSKWARGTMGFVVRGAPSGVETYWRVDNEERRRGKRNCRDVLPPLPFVAPRVDWRRSGAR